MSTLTTPLEHVCHPSQKSKLELRRANPFCKATYLSLAFNQEQTNPLTGCRCDCMEVGLLCMGLRQQGRASTLLRLPPFHSKEKVSVTMTSSSVWSSDSILQTLYHSRVPLFDWKLNGTQLCFHRPLVRLWPNFPWKCKVGWNLSLLSRFFSTLGVGSGAKMSLLGPKWSFLADPTVIYSSMMAKGNNLEKRRCLMSAE